jgi:hypothetical protein
VKPEKAALVSGAIRIQYLHGNLGVGLRGLKQTFITETPDPWYFITPAVRILIVKTAVLYSAPEKKPSRLVIGHVGAANLEISCSDLQHTFASKQNLT